MLTNLASNDCCLDNSSPSGRVTTQTVVLAKQAAASSQQRSSERIARTPFLILFFCSFQFSYIVPHFAPSFLVQTKKARGYQLSPPRLSLQARRVSLVEIGKVMMSFNAPLLHMRTALTEWQVNVVGSIFG